MTRIVIGLAVFVLALSFIGLTGSAQDKKKEKDPKEGKKGTAIGTLVAKEKNWIEVKADGEEKGRKYIPQWVGGAPANGGGPDKDMLKVIHDLKVGSRIEVQWLFEEHLRVLSVKVLRGPQDDTKTEEKKLSKTVGTLQAREENKWLEIKADGEEKGRKYHVHAKLPDKLLEAVRQAPIGSRVSVEWISTNHGPLIHSIEVIGKAGKE